MSEWIATKDRMPESKTDVIFAANYIHQKELVYKVGYYTKTYGFDYMGPRESKKYVTHWMPLIPAPDNQRRKEPE